MITARCQTSGLTYSLISCGASISRPPPPVGKGGKCGLSGSPPQLVFIITMDRGGLGWCAVPGKARAQSEKLHAISNENSSNWQCLYKSIHSQHCCLKEQSINEINLHLTMC